MKKGTILYVGNFELPDKGASANRVISNSKIFESLGYDVRFLGVTKAEHFEGIKQSAADKRIFEESYPSSSVQWFKHMVSAGNINAVAEKCSDLCLIILYNVPFSLVSAVKHEIRNVKIAYDCTEWNPYADGNFFKKKIKVTDEKLIRTKLSKKIDSLIVISKVMESQYKGSDMLLLPPLIDINDPIWHQQKEEHSDFEFLFAGDINGNKERLDLIIEAVASVPNARLRVIGVEKNEFESRYLDVKPIAEKVIFMGRLSHTETVRYVLSCDCYIFIREADRRNSAGFPTKFVEAYTSGVPIITTDVSDISDYMNESRGIVLKTADKDQLSEAMIQMISSQYINSGLDHSFHYENYMDITERWLNKVL